MTSFFAPTSRFFQAGLASLMLTITAFAADVAPEAAATSAPLPTDAPQSFTFVAFGCMPYASSGGTPEAFGRVIAEFNRQNPAFAVHLGDILASDESCTDELLLRRRDEFNRFNGPLIYTPGDNEWTDTHTAKAGRFSPTERLARIRELFFAEERSLGANPIPLVTQRRDATYSRFVENARWARGGVLFTTIHVVGSHNNRQPAVPGAMEEFAERDAANAAWLRDTFAAARSGHAPGVAVFFQANPFAEDKGKPGYEDGFERTLRTLEDEARSFGKPVLIVHADEHRYRLNFGFRFQADGAPLPNVTRLETFGASALHGVIVLVDPRSAQVFVPGPLLVPGNPLPNLPKPKVTAAP